MEGSRMTKEDIFKRANKDIAKAKARGDNPKGFTDRDPYPQAPKTVKTKKKPNQKA